MWDELVHFESVVVYSTMFCFFLALTLMLSAATDMHSGNYVSDGLVYVFD